MDNDSKLAEKLNSILPYLNERQKRLLLAAEARSWGYGGVSRVSRISGISRPTIHQGLRELEQEPLDGVMLGNLLFSAIRYNQSSYYDWCRNFI